MTESLLIGSAKFADSWEGSCRHLKGPLVSCWALSSAQFWEGEKKKWRIMVLVHTSTASIYLIKLCCSFEGLYTNMWHSVNTEKFPSPCEHIRLNQVRIKTSVSCNFTSALSISWLSWILMSLLCSSRKQNWFFVMSHSACLCGHSALQSLGCTYICMGKFLSTVAWMHKLDTIYKMIIWISWFRY